MERSDVNCNHTPAEKPPPDFEMDWEAECIALLKDNQRLSEENERLHGGIRKIVHAYGDQGWATTRFCIDLNKLLAGETLVATLRQRNHTTTEIRGRP